MLKSLRNRIILAFSLIIISAIIISTLVAIWSAEHQLEEFVSDISWQQAGLAGIVEVEFNARGHLDSISTTLKKQSLGLPQQDESPLPDYDPEVWNGIVKQYGVSNARSVSEIMQIETKQLSDSAEFSDIVDRWYQAHALVYRHSDTKDLKFNKAASYLLNSDFSIRYSRNDEGPEKRLSEERLSEKKHSGERHSEEESLEKEPYENRIPEEEHHIKEHHLSAPFYEWSTGDLVGYIVTESHNEFSHESSKFTRGTFTNNLYGGLITAIFAFGIGLWLANRINSPVKALTQAATRLAESGDTEHIKVHSDDELGQMSTAFNRMADAIGTQQQIRRQMIADISHELNTPLSIMRLEAKGMVDGMQTPKEAATNIKREIDLLRGLISDLELIAEADQNAIQLVKEPVAVSRFLTEVIERWQSNANSQGVQFQLEIETLQSRCTFDPNRMRQALGNLIRNALQHTQQGGKIILAAEVISNQFTISVRDNGQGIVADHLPHIFNRFYRIDDALQYTSGSRGLGLAIVKQVVELHNGRVWATSEPGIGSAFFLSIPRK